MGVEDSEWRMEKMKIKWVRCNTNTTLMWLKLYLANKPLQCVEHAGVHELVHMPGCNHSERLSGKSAAFLPKWLACRKSLKQGILGHAVWH